MAKKDNWQNFKNFSRPLCQFQPQLTQCILGWRGFKFVQTKGYAINGPITTKLGKKYPLVKGIQVCSNEGPRSFSREDANEIAKIYWWNLKIFLSKTKGLISTKISIFFIWNFNQTWTPTKHPWVKRTHILQTRNIQISRRLCFFFLNQCNVTTILCANVLLIGSVSQVLLLMKDKSFDEMKMLKIKNLFVWWYRITPQIIWFIAFMRSCLACVEEFLKRDCADDGVRSVLRNILRLRKQSWCQVKEVSMESKVRYRKVFK